MTLYERLAGFFRAPSPPPVAALEDREMAWPHLDSAGIVNALTGLGGPGDKGSAGRPNTNATPLSDTELRSAYLFSAPSRRVIDLVAKRACRTGWTVPELGGEERRLRIGQQCERAFRWARLYGGALLLPVTLDDVPRGYAGREWAWLREPLDLARVGRISALHAFDAFEVYPHEDDDDPRSPTFRTPKYWTIASKSLHVTVHASRVVWVRGCERPSDASRRGNRMPDDSVLQAMWDEVQRLSQTMAGGAKIAQELRESVLKLAGHAQQNTSDQKKKYQAQLGMIARMRSLLSLTVLGKEDEYESVSHAPTGFSDLSDAAKSMFSMASGIPEVILFGATPEGLNTDGDSAWQGFRQLVSDYQEDRRPELERLHEIVYAQQDGPTGGRAPEDWVLEFRPLDEPSEQERAEVRRTIAQTDVLNIRAGIYSAQEVCERRYGPDGFEVDLVGMTPLDPDEEARKAAERAAMMAEATAQAEPAASTEPEPGARGDAADEGACLVWVPAPDLGLRTRVEEALGQVLDASTDPPHVTVLYLGPGLGVRAVGEVLRVVREEARDVGPGPLAGATLRAFPPGDSGTPIVVELDQAWVLDELNARLVRRLAHRITARQHARFRAHVTIGYARQPLTPDALARLTAIDVSGLRLPIGELVVSAEGEVFGRVAVG